jgi:hypothetical protein
VGQYTLLEINRGIDTRMPVHFLDDVEYSMILTARGLEASAQWRGTGERCGLMARHDYLTNVRCVQLSVVWKRRGDFRSGV